MAPARSHVLAIEEPPEVPVLVLVPESVPVREHHKRAMRLNESQLVVSTVERRRGTTTNTPGRSTRRTASKRIMKRTSTSTMASTTGTCSSSPTSPSPMGMVTPSPQSESLTRIATSTSTSRRNNNRQSAQKTSPLPNRHLFASERRTSNNKNEDASGKKTSTQQVAVAVRKQLFQGTNETTKLKRIRTSTSTSTTSSTRHTTVACSSAPRIPAKWLLQQQTPSSSSSLSSPLDSNSSPHPPKQHLSPTHKNGRTQGKRIRPVSSRKGRLLVALDSLASLSFGATNNNLMLVRTKPRRVLAAKPTSSTISEPPKQQTEAPNQLPVVLLLPSSKPHSFKKDPKTIPPELVCLLAPNPHTRKLRTSQEVLEEFRKEARPPAAPRTLLPRTCNKKGSLFNYSEDSENDEMFNARLPSFDNHQEPQESSSPPSDPIPTEVVATTRTSTAQEEDESSPDSSLTTPSIITPAFNTNTSTDTNTNTNKPSPLAEDTTASRKSSPSRKKTRRKTLELVTARKKAAPCKRCRPSKKSSSTNTRTVERSRRTKPFNTTLRTKEPSASASPSASPSASHNATTRNPSKSTQDVQENLDGTSSKTRAHRAVDKRLAAEESESLISSEPTNTDNTTTTTQVKNRAPEDPTTAYNESITSGTNNAIQSIVKKVATDSISSPTPSSRRKKSSKKKKKSKTKSKVRFAPLPTTTTTFSVKIRVKTSASPTKRKSSKRRNSSRQLAVAAAPPSLSESAVQSITNQITQACLSQASNVHGTTPPEKPKDDKTSDDDSMSEDEEELTSESEEIVSNSEDADSDSITEKVPGRERKEAVQASKSQVEGKKECNSKRGRPSKMSGKRKRNTPSRTEPTSEPQADVKSVASEITMEHFWEKEGINEAARGKHRPSEESRERKHKHSLDEQLRDIEEGSVGHVHTNVEDATNEDDHDDRISRDFAADDSFGPQAADDASLHSEMYERKSRRKQWGGNDSLAGSKFSSSHKEARSPPKKRSRRTLTCSDSLAGFSLASTKSVNIVTPKVPKEVSVNRSSPLPLRRKQDSSPRSSGRLKEKAPEAPQRKALEAHQNPPPLENDETVVTNRSTESRKSAWSHVQDGECGKCSGCKREFDCLTCDKCIARLQEGIRYGEATGCLKRMCKVIRKHKHVESLGQMMIKPRSATIQPRSTTASSVAGGDWSTRTGEAGSIVSKPAKRQSRAARLWCRHWSEKKTSGLGSASAVSASMGMPMAAIKPKSTRSRGRGKGRKKNPLHDMELPMPTDGSVASWMEGRKCLRALMQYDEADQDWI
jgi:hypothetical protein